MTTQIDAAAELAARQASLDRFYAEVFQMCLDELAAEAETEPSTDQVELAA